MAIETTLKTFEITAKKRWSTEPKTISNTHTKKLGNAMQVFTVCAALPTNFSHVVSIVVNGVLAFDLKEGQRGISTSVIGGGGRFEVRRTFFDRECVEVKIIFKDVVYFTKRPPSIKIIAAIKVEEKTGEAK